MSGLVRSITGVLERKPSAPRVRKQTPPRITEHKPPKPEGSAPTRSRSASSVVKSPGDERRSLRVDASAAAVQTTGYLTKRGVVGNFLTGNKWKKRWFVLDKGELTYYSDKSAWERGEKPLKGNHISMKEVRVEVATEGADIALLPKDAAASKDRVWQFICESNAEIDRWCHAFTAHGAAGKEATTSAP